MNELRASFEGLKYADVSTYIQTGNVLFSSGSKSEAAIAATIEQRLADDFGDSPAVILRTVPEFLRIAAASPYAKAGANPSRHHVTFLATKPTARRPPLTCAPSACTATRRHRIGRRTRAGRLRTCPVTSRCSGA